MKRIHPLATASLAVLAIGIAGCSAGGPDHAEIVSVTPVSEIVETPREVCHDEAVTWRRPERDREVGGTVAGALIGGAVGNRVGSGSGRKAATVAGAVAGGLIGREVDRRHDGGRVEQSLEPRCETVIERSERVVGYDVTYEYQGRTATVRLDERPEGDRLPVRNEVVVDLD